MEGILKSDIFFFITSVTVLFLGVAGLFVMVQIYHILKEVKEIARQTRQGAEGILEDLDDIRDAVRSKGFGIRTLFNVFRGIFEKKAAIKKVRVSEK